MQWLNLFTSLTGCQLTRFLENKSPYQVLHGEKANIDHLKVFGCLYFANTLSSQRKKSDAKARRCVFLGYKTKIKGFVVHDIANRETFISKNLKFYEKIFPYNQKPVQPSSTNQNTIVRDLFHLDFLNTPNPNQPLLDHQQNQDEHTQPHLQYHSDTQIQNLKINKMQLMNLTHLNLNQKTCQTHLNLSHSHNHNLNQEDQIEIENSLLT